MRKSRADAALFSLAGAFALAIGFAPAATGKSTGGPRTDAISPGGSAGFKFAAGADAYVTSTKPRTNYGGATRLKSESSPLVESYLRFDGGNVTGQITRATLWLYAFNGSNVGYAVHSVSDPWQETSISYANAPPISANAIKSPSSYPSNTWTTVDVTGFVGATGSANLAVTSPSTNALSLASRESGASGPVLVVETTNPDTSPPAIPAGLSVTATGATSF